MPEIGETVIEKVTKLSWRDKIKDPRSVQITLADALQDVQTIVREEQKKAGGGGRAGAKVDEENKKLIGETASGLYSYIIQTSTNIIMHVHDTLQGYSTIEQTASAITLAVNSAGSNLYNSIIQQTSTSIHMAVSNAASGIYSAIDVQANRISLVVQGTGDNARIKPAQIVAAINNGSSSIKLSADHIELDGNTIATYLKAVDLTVNALTVDGGEVNCGVINSGAIDCTGINTNDGAVTCGNVNAAAISGTSLTIGSNSASWKSATLKEPMIGVKHYFMYANSQGGTTAAGTVYAGACLGTTDTTIYYLGHS